MVSGGGLAHLAGYGLADLDAERPMAADAVMPCGSLTKLVTAMAVVQLGDGGRLDLDAPVAEFAAARGAAVEGGERLPWRLGGPDAERVTARHLLAHSSGLPRGPYLPAEGWRAAARRALPDPLPLLFAPGSRCKYSNLGYALLAALVAEVAGRPFWDFVTERLFAPLGMAASGGELHRRCGPHPPVVGYQRDHYRSLVRRRDALCPAPRLHAPRGACDLVSSAGDLARLLSCLLHRGELDGRRVLSPAAVAEILRPQIPLGRGADYALGVQLRRRFGRPSFEQDAGHTGYSALLIGFPDDGVGGVVLCNRCSAVVDLRKILLRALGRRLPGASRSTAAEEDRRRQRLSSFAGSYRSRFGVLTVRRRREGLRADLGGESFALTEYGPRTFVQEGGPLDGYLLGFDRDAEECFAGPVHFAAAGEPPAAAIPRAWQAWCGRYRHPLIGTVEVFARRGRLMYAFYFGEATELRHLGGGEFRQRRGPFAGETLRFVAGDGGEPVLETGYMRFERQPAAVELPGHRTGE